MQGRRRRLLLLVLALAVLVSIAAGVAARPPPQPLCEVCTDDVLPGSAVETSTVTIDIDDAGTGHWVVTFDLDEDVSPDEARLQRNARESLRGHHDEQVPRNLSVDVSSDTVVMTYEIDQMGHRSVGDVLVIDYFYSHGDERHWYGVNADTVVVHGPDDTVLTRGPEDLRVNESAIALAGVHGDVFDQTISNGWYLAFAEEDTVYSSAGTAVGIGVDIAGAKLDGIHGATWLPIVILISVLVVLYRWRRFLAQETLQQRLQFGLALTAALTVASVVVELAVGSSGPLLERLYAVAFSLLFGAQLTSDLLIAIVFAGTLQLVLVAPRFEFEVPTTWMREGGVAVSAVILFGSIWAAGTDMGATELYGMIVAVLVPFLFLPLGQTVRLRNRALLVSTIVFSPVILVLGFGPFTAYATMFFPVLYVPWALLTGIVGTIGYSYGLTLRDGPSP